MSVDLDGVPDLYERDRLPNWMQPLYSFCAPLLPERSSSVVEFEQAKTLLLQCLDASDEPLVLAQAASLTSNAQKVGFSLLAAATALFAIALTERPSVDSLRLTAEQFGEAALRVRPLAGPQLRVLLAGLTSDSLRARGYWRDALGLDPRLAWASHYTGHPPEGLSDGWAELASASPDNRRGLLDAVAALTAGARENGLSALATLLTDGRGGAQAAAMLVAELAFEVSRSPHNHASGARERMKAALGALSGDDPLTPLLAVFGRTALSNLAELPALAQEWAREAGEEGSAEALAAEIQQAFRVDGVQRLVAEGYLYGLCDLRAAWFAPRGRAAITRRMLLVAALLATVGGAPSPPGTAARAIDASQSEMQARRARYEQRRHTAVRARSRTLLHPLQTLAPTRAASDLMAELSWLARWFPDCSFSNEIVLYRGDDGKLRVRVGEAPLTRDVEVRLWQVCGGPMDVIASGYRGLPSGELLRMTSSGVKVEADDVLERPGTDDVTVALRPRTVVLIETPSP